MTVAVSDPDAQTRLAALALSAVIHIAAGIILFYAYPPASSRGSRSADDGQPLIVELIPARSEGAATPGAHGEAMRAENRDPRPMRSARAMETPQAPPDGTLRGLPANEDVARANSSASSDAIPLSLSAADLLTYRARLQAHLAQYRIYPDTARASGASGVVQVRFLIDHQGRLIDVWIERSSGMADLDREALASIGRAQPLPTPPSNWPDRLDISLPIKFSLG